jgi:Flp pilus assembly protein TadD
MTAKGRWLAAALLLGMLAVFPGCGGRADRNAGARDPAVRAQALIDAGNAAFRSGDHALAARRYAAAAVVRPDDPAAYYGMGMALSKLGRDEDARAAYARARQLMQAQTRR